MENKRTALAGISLPSWHRLARRLLAMAFARGPLDSLPPGLTDKHLRDIGLSRQQIYLYRSREARRAPTRF
ncbi:hypothetical protein [Sagittula stellata]|nr:hypothetical protein [Sagittula stellata]